MLMSNRSEEPEQVHDQDAEPSLNSPEEGRPDGRTDDGEPDDPRE
jgi:hypothetical protein